MVRFQSAAVLGALAAAISGGAAFAEEDTGGPEDEIIVTATRSERELFDVPAVASVISEEEIAANLAGDIKDLIRFEPGVSVRTAPSRFTAAFSSLGRDGNAGFNIRGLDGNRVLIQVDGVRLPDGFSFGPAAFGRGDYVDLDLLRSVEIVRGPASALYGSDGLAGVVSFTTRDPVDLLGGEDAFALRLRAQYASVDESLATSGLSAGRWRDWSALLALTHREGRESDNQGENDATNATRTAPNPQDIEPMAILARVVFEPNPNHRLRLTADGGTREIVTEALSARAIPPLGGTSVLDLDGVDESERGRLGLDYLYDGGGLVDRVFLALYGQESSLRQFSAEDRNVAVDRERETTFDNAVWGASAQIDSVLNWGGVEHRIIFGGDYSLTEQSAIRNGVAPTPPDTFPQRPFPLTAYGRGGLFLVDEITLFDGTLTLFPGVRYDVYDLSAHDDALYSGLLADQSGEHVTPKFGLVAWPTPRFGVFFNYAAGFKAPAPNEVNNAFENLTIPGFAYTSVPNPDLRPETSDAVEAGLRWRDQTLLGGEWRASTSAFAAWYEDFISQEIVAGTGALATPFIFQYVNLSEVEIWGLEARADAARANGFGLTLSASFAEGEQITSGARAPLQSIDPLKLVAGISYNDPAGHFGGQFIVTHAARKAESDAAPGAFRPDAFTIADATFYWTVSDAAMLRLGVFNLTDEAYWWWSDVRGSGLTPTSPLRDAYTQPGRNVSVSLAYRF